MINLEVLAATFKNWRIVGKNASEFTMVSKASNRLEEIPGIITYLNELSTENKPTVQIDDFKLTVRFKEVKKYKRIYTSGCFDIFHYGHLNILAKSKELCDYLIVGISTDELIVKEKGRKPVIPFLERMKVVQAIGLVDEVIPQEDKNKQKIVDAYAIDAISVGDDWRGRYPKVSCAMEYFPYTANVSSTILKDTLKLTEKLHS